MTIDSSLFQGTDIQIILWGILANVLLGVLVSFLKDNFNFHHLSNFLHGMVFPYLIVYAILKLADGVLPLGTLITQVVYVFVVLTLLAGIWEKLGHFGLPTPKWLARDER